MSHTPIQKDVEPSIDRVLDLIKPASYTIKLKGHHLDNSVFEINKEENQFLYSSSSPIIKGLQTDKELQFESTSSIELVKGSVSLFSLGKYILVNSITYNDEFTRKLFSGSISSLTTARSLASFNDQYLRFIIPCGASFPFKIHDFQRRFFNTPQRRGVWYLTCQIQDKTLHLYDYKLGKDHYLVIDCINHCRLKDFQKMCFNLLLAIGFLKGTLVHDECFILSFQNPEMAVPDHILYYSMRGSVITNQGIFTTNPFSVNHDREFERDEKGQITKAEHDRLYDGMIDFPEKVLSNLVSSFHDSEKLQRAALLNIEGQISSLEIRIPNYYVAIEAITGHILSSTERSPLSPISEKKVAEKLIKDIKVLVRKRQTECGFSDDEFNLTILEKNIDKLNAPPNADKLAESFGQIGYKLSEEEKKLLKDRNRYLHGSFLKTADDDKAFRDALHISLRLNFLIAVLLLKLSGFDGKIINYASLWSHVTERVLDEERLIKI